MVEVIVLSDDEDDSQHGMESTRKLERWKCDPNVPNAVGLDRRRTYKLVLVDSRGCSRMPRPRYLPISFAHKASPRTARDSSNPMQEDMSTSEEAKRSAGEIYDEEEEDSDYEDVRPAKRRKTALKKEPKRHGKLIAPDWEVVRNGEVGVRNLDWRPMPLGKAASDRKKARAYVKKLTANVDWEYSLRQLEMLKSPPASSGLDETNGAKIDVRPRRGPSQANRLKQFWHNVLTKSVLRMHNDGSK